MEKVMAVVSRHLKVREGEAHLRVKVDCKIINGVIHLLLFLLQLKNP